MEKVKSDYSCKKGERSSPPGRSVPAGLLFGSPSDALRGSAGGSNRLADHLQTRRRKTFRSPTIQYRIFVLESHFNQHCQLHCLTYFFKGLLKKKIQNKKLNPDKKVSGDSAKGRITVPALISPPIGSVSAPSDDVQS